MPSIPLLHPDEFFGRLEHDSLGLSLIIVTLGVIISVSSILLYIDIPGLVAFGFIIASAIISVILWMITAGIMYGVSAVFGGKGSLKRTVAYVGWGYLPSLLWAIILLIFVVYSVQTGGMLDDMLTDSLLNVTLIVAFSSLIALWQGYIWIYAIKHARSVSTKHALLSVLIPILFHMVPL